MRAMTVIPGEPASAELTDLPDPEPGDGELLVEPLRLGVCGTDREILAGDHGEPPPGSERLVLGHELLARVREAPDGSDLEPGRLVAAIVRRPDPVPCSCCARGEWDMCRNGRYTERGIKERHGFGAERFRLEPEFAVKVDKRLGLSAVLLEPTTIVAKAWLHADCIARRARSAAPRRLLVTGAGPVGLLAALLGVQRGLDLHVFARAGEGTAVDLTQALGGRYHAGAIADVLTAVRPDLVMECTGATAVIAGVLGNVAPNGMVCLLGVSPLGRQAQLDLGRLNRAMVLENQVVFGSVNANRAHYEAAAAALAAADPAWLARLISRRVPLTRWAEALERRPDDIKVVIDFTL